MNQFISPPNFEMNDEYDFENYTVNEGNSEQSATNNCQTFFEPNDFRIYRN